MGKNKHNKQYQQKVWTAPATVVKVLPPKPFYPGVERSKGLTLALADNIYTFALNSLTVGYPVEIAGFGQVTDDRITWLWWDQEAKGSSGHVDSSQGRGMVAALEAGKTINLQWHTHPMMGTFWSQTDKDDQESLMESIVQNEPSGSFYFLVFNHKSFCLRRFDWDNYKVCHIQDGYATSNDIPLNIGEGYVYSSKAKNGKTGGLITPAGDDNYDWLGYGGLYGDGLWTPESDLTWWDKHNLDMMGDIKDPEHYRLLFEVMEVEFGYWHTLKIDVEEAFGLGMYEFVLNNPDLWESLI